MRKYCKDCEILVWIKGMKDWANIFREMGQLSGKMCYPTRKRENHC